jgi:S1-C subfamily serine protease
LYETKLGLELQALSARMAASDERIGDEHRGPIITGIDPDGPARDKPLVPANARRGWVDIITHVNDERVRTLEDMEAALASIEAGEIVTLRVYQVQGNQAATSIVRVRAAGSGN